MEIMMCRGRMTSRHPYREHIHEVTSKHNLLIFLGGEDQSSLPSFLYTEDSDRIMIKGLLL